ncbi:serine/threonine-protein phosphatase BSL1 isoform X2 [Helianthus annuus]|uniref:serine/threonine-protein phosphatase BSL1 isoform X2 n=1 Tax=Helianthus annuus TaxID=4232 RepID=UPI0016533E84|nr:serine/threonine-protein phosphatase BSL1 isoform X2 [Helianthus annuus]
MYATAGARSDGMFLLCGGRDTSGVPLADAYGLLMHKNGQWEWTLAPGVSPSSRYQHAAPDRVTDICNRNKLQLIIRAHECLMNGFERFVHGQLITLFSATNYCVIGRGLVVVPKLIHPLPPPLEPETSPKSVEERH